MRVCDGQLVNQICFSNGDQSVEFFFVYCNQQEDNKRNDKANVCHDDEAEASTTLLVNVNELWELWRERERERERERRQRDDNNINVCSLLLCNDKTTIIITSRLIQEIFKHFYLQMPTDQID